MSMSGKGFAIGLLTGVAAGTAIALLYAPDTGKNTRGRISYQLNSYMDELRSLIEQLKNEKQKISSQAKEDSDKVIEDAKERADGLIREAESLLENIEKSGK
ncbi:MAG: YtxH domain-containing protein [Balneolaceae bacterium]